MALTERRTWDERADDLVARLDEAISELEELTLSPAVHLALDDLKSKRCLVMMTGAFRSLPVST